MIDREFYLPKSWIDDRQRCADAGLRLPTPGSAPQHPGHVDGTGRINPLRNQQSNTQTSRTSPRNYPGYEKHETAGDGRSGNVRNGTRSKTVLTDTTGPVQIDVPRERAGTFEPQIVKKRQRRLSGVDEVVLSLYAKGLTTGEISVHLAEIYGASVSRRRRSPGSPTR